MVGNLHLLKRIKSPEDLKKMSYNDLEILAEEIRRYILEVVSKNGGHLASNLGVVELTIALHKVFSSPRDKIIWDVGHQSYVHKLLTGRFDEFSKLRQYKGISGFPKRKESIHDIFETGHSSTSISAAVGFAHIRDLTEEKYEVIAVIGDGALTGGMAFEALNYAGHVKKDFIVILNDNEMSISPNIGGLSSYLTRLRADPAYYKLKSDVEYILNNIPAIGKSVAKTIERVKGSLKYFLVPGMLFEELGFKYFGPLDGHNIKQVVSTLEMAKKTKGPKIIHVITKKGKGYRFAEENPDYFHGIAPFDIDTGRVIKPKKGPSYSEVFGDFLCTLAEGNDKIVAITAAMPDGTGLKKFSQRFPNRFFDVGIAEQHAVTMAAAMAMEGFIPVVAIYSTFLQRAYDQIIHDVCLQNLPVIFAVDRAGIVGEDGETHHGVFDLSFLRHIPNMVVMSPKDESELKSMLITAVKSSSPVAIRYPRGSGIGVDKNQDINPIEIGRGEILRKGKDINILSIGSMVYPSLEAAKMLTDHGIDACVVNCRFLKPIDGELLKRLAEISPYFITVEENALQGGFGSAVLEFFERENLFDLKIKRLGIPDKFLLQGPRELLLKEIDLTPEGIVNDVLTILRSENFGREKTKT